MAVKTFNTRIKNKIDKKTTLGSLVPLKGELVIGGPGSSSLGSNSLDDPYIAKIGDGTNSWNNLPPIGYMPLKGETTTSSNLGSGIFVTSVIIPSDERKYFYEEINSNNDVDNIQISLSGTNPYLGEHYILIKNVGNSDVLFNNVTADFGSGVTVNINTRQDYIVAGDICELQIKIFKIGTVYYMTVIPQLGIAQTITLENNENVWNVNRN